MTTPSDPYSRANNRPFDDEDVLAPLASASEASAQSPASAGSSSATAGISPAAAGNSPASVSSSPALHGGDSPAEAPSLPPIEPVAPERRSIFANTDPAFDHGDRPLGGTGLPNEPTAPSPSSFAFDGPTTDAPFALPEREPARTRATLADAVGISTEPAPTLAAPTQTAPVAPAPLARPSLDWDSTITPTQPFEELPGGRGWTHTGILIVTLLLIPFAWYLVSDAGVRLALVEKSPWETGTLNLAAIGELVGGIAVLGLTWYLAKLSSLGAIVVGTLVAIFGLIPVVAPTLARDQILKPLADTIGDYNAFTGNVVDHLTLDLGSGRILVFGALIFFTGITAHVTRRAWEKRGAIVARHTLTTQGS